MSGIDDPMHENDLAVAFMVGTTTIAVVLVTATWANPAAWIVVGPIGLYTAHLLWARRRNTTSMIDRRLHRIESRVSELAEEAAD